MRMSVQFDRFAEQSDVAERADLTIRCGRETATGPHRPGQTLLQAARSLGLDPPSSCESGSCATCIARIVRGAATMRNNEALDDDEIAEGWVLTCQAEPIGADVHVIYE
ncbi:MAG: 2Fe-2S iron-sulfur cluster binding domain-containing protein [Nocardia sp.]|nr:2Fe-2S iron-sulfur cluster binding domain-containing protein [Nocardia sp.]